MTSGVACSVRATTRGTDHAARTRRLGIAALHFRLRGVAACSERPLPAGIPAPESSPSSLPRATPATNYRRWWNHPWRVVEPAGQRAAGEWTADDAARLVALSADAHRHGLWLRIYTLNGVEGDRDGWGANYNFGSLAAVTVRWRAAIDAGVDFIATDQYADFARLRDKR